MHAVAGLCAQGMYTFPQCWPTALAKYPKAFHETSVHFVVSQAEGCIEAGAASAKQPLRLGVPPVPPAGPDAQAE